MDDDSSKKDRPKGVLILRGGFSWPSSSVEYIGDLFKMNVIVVPKDCDIEYWDLTNL